MKHLNTLLLLVFAIIGLQAQDAYIATLSGDQEVPPVETDAEGTITIEWINDSTITVAGSFKGLSSDMDTSIAGGAHLHMAYAGNNGPVSIPIQATVSEDLRSGTFEADSNSYVLDTDQKSALEERRFYVNIHTLDHPSGELRGQVLPEAEVHYFLNLSGENEVPPVTSNGSGALAIEVYQDSFVLSGSFMDLTDELDTSIAGGAHLHSGKEGENGPVVFPINASLDSGLQSGVFTAMDNRFALSDDQKTIFAIGGYYANLHTLEHPSGELRGQIDAITADRYNAYLTGRQEVLPIASLGSGEVNIDLVGDRIVVSGGFQNLSSPINTAIAGGAHIHMGYAGQNGPVSIPLHVSLGFNPAIGFFQADSNVYVLDSAQMAALQERRLYVNVHSMLYPSGELRGQVLPEANRHYFVNLLGSNEVTPVMSMGSGAVAIEEYDDHIILSGSFQGLESDLATEIAGGAHMHTGMAGENGPVDFPINATENADMRSGVFTAEDNNYSLDNEQLMRLRNRGYYINLHTEDHPSGELRGQMAAASTQVAYRAHLSGSNEVPSVISTGGGQVMAEFEDSTIWVHGRFDDLEDKVLTSLAGGLHIHAGFAGMNGPVQFPLNTEFDMDSLGGRLMATENRFDLSTDLITLKFYRGLYINIHSEGHQGGEIRGQFLPEAQIVFTGNLLGSYAVPNALTRASGGIKAEMNGSRLAVSGFYENLSSAVDTNIAGGAHLHLGLAGSTGPVNFPLQSLFPDETLQTGFFVPVLNEFELDTAQMIHLKARHYYANIHTEEYPSGELRAQLLPEANYYMVAPLSGVSQALPQGVDEASLPVNTAGSGMAILEVKGQNVTATGSFNELGSAVDTSILGGAHLHKGLAGQNGPITFEMDTELFNQGTSGRLEARNNNWLFNEGQLDSLRKRMFYVNVHTADYETGEIRGQLLGLANAYFHANLSGLNEVQPLVSGGNGKINAELSGDELKLSGSFAQLNSKFNAEVAGGAHLHIGHPSENGGVDVLLNTRVSQDSLRGEYHLEENTFELSSFDLTALMNEEYYVNIHSDDSPSGELRGQLLESINYFPMNPPVINNPMDGDSIILEGDGGTIATIDWDDSAMDENEVVYIWEIALDTAFEVTLIRNNVGNDNEISFTYGQLDTLLMSLGVEEGETVGVYHRVRASDGSVMSSGPRSLAYIKRNMLTDLTDAFKRHSKFNIYPTVTNDQIRIEAELPEAANSEIRILNAMGQLVDHIPATRNGQYFEDQFIFSGQPKGLYLVEWIVEGEHVATERVLLK